MVSKQCPNKHGFFTMCTKAARFAQVGKEATRLVQHVHKRAPADGQTGQADCYERPPLRVSKTQKTARNFSTRTPKTARISSTRTPKLHGFSQQRPADCYNLHELRVSPPPKSARIFAADSYDLHELRVSPPPREKTVQVEHRVCVDFAT